MHQWSTTPINNQTADARAQFPEGQPIPSLNNGVRGAMATAALWRDDNLGASLLATLGQNNVYTVSTGQGLIDPKSQGTGLTANITHPYSLSLAFDTSLSGSLANPPTLVVDGAPAVPLLRSDGSALKDGDILTTRPYVLLGDLAKPTTDTAVTRARVMNSLGSTVADFAHAAGIGRRNRIADPGFQISQLNGSTALQLVSGTPGYCSDTVYADWQGGGGATAQRIAGPTPSGAPFWHRFTITTANPNPGIYDRLRFVIPFEGQDIVDLLFGTADARTINLAIDVRMPAGSYAVAIRNGKAASRAWLGSFTVLPAENGIGVVKAFTIPGDVAGSWASGTSRALEISISVLAGTALQASAGWAGGDYMAPTLNAANALLTNGMANVGSTFDIGAPRFAEGSAPQDFELPVYEESLRRCRRWLRKITRFVGVTDLSGGMVYALVELDQPMRVQPAVVIPAPLKVIIPGLGYYTQSNTGAFPDFSGDASTGVILVIQNFTGLPNNIACLSYFDGGQYVLLDSRL